MKITELKVGMKVYDRWYLLWGTGIVTKILKTRVFVKFPGFKVTKYDAAHVKFLARHDR